MDNNFNYAPGWPGSEPRWTSSAKSGIGTALNRESKIWFSLSHGILNEIYYPRVDQACTRDMGLIVTDGKDFFSEEKRNALHEINYMVDGVPAYKLVNTCVQGRYRIEKEILSDPHRDVVLQQTRFIPMKGALSDYHLYALLAPHLGNQGADNTAFIGDYKGVPMLFAERDGLALALACSAPWRQCSAGFVGFSDGWQDLSKHKNLTWNYLRAAHGNVALVGEVDLSDQDNGFTFAIGFGLNSAEAGLRALSSLQEGYPSICQAYVDEWASWQEKVKIPSGGTSTKKQNQLFRTSATVLRSHEAKRFPGGLIASLRCL